MSPPGQTDHAAALAECRNLAGIVEATPDAAFAIDRDRRITSWNAGAAKMWGRPAAATIGSPMVELFAPADRVRMRHVIDLALAGRAVGQQDAVALTAEGELFDAVCTFGLLEGGDGLAVIGQDITERKRMEEALRHGAERDALTGLYNRRYLESAVERAASLAARGEWRGALLTLDVDHFKMVNDTYGHAAGDELLCRLAATLREHVRRSDVVARLGGDELAVLLGGVEPAGALGVATTLVDAATQCVQRFGATISAGVVHLPGPRPAGAEELMSAADAALYEAKETGRGRLVVADLARPGPLQWADRVRRAVREDRLTLCAQPIVSLQGARPVARHELLVRLVDGDGRKVPPGAFLPAAERFGLMSGIDRWVIERALALAARGMPVAANLSARSITDERFTTWLTRTVAAARLPPGALLLEITETAAIASMEHAATLCATLARAGCRTALDDFGTGFGSFSYLKHLPVAALKIDMEFVRELPGSTRDRRIVEAIVSVADAHGMTTIAEGVELPDQATAVRECGVDYGQGWLFGRPAPLA